MESRLKGWLAPTLVVAAFVVLVAAVRPLGDFPLNDDWSYAWSVKVLREEGRLAFTDWVSMPLVAQVLWGWLFTLPAGFSFTALRLSTLVLAVIGGIAVYALVGRTAARRDVAAVAALTLLTSPLFFVLSVSFMTDVPCAAAMLVGILLFVRDLEAPNRRDYTLAVAVCLAATLVRQVALAVPLGYAVAALRRDGVAPSRLIRAAAPTVLCAAAFAGWTVALDRWLGLPAWYDFQTRLLLQTLSSAEVMLIRVISNLTALSITVGLFVVPVIVFTARPLWRRLGRTFASPGLLIAFILAVLAIPIANLERGLPLIGNILHDFGLGPRTLRDTYILGLTPLPRAPGWLWPALTAIAMPGAAVLIAVVAAALKRAARPGRYALARPHAAVELFVAVALLVYALPLTLAPIFDRYVLVPVALGCILIAMLAFEPAEVPAAARPRGLAACAGLVAMVPLAWFSVAATHDYLAWNRARWAALDRLMAERSVPVRQIDGGFEFNGWFLHDQAQYGATRPGRSWWWISDDRYVASFGPVPGYQAIIRQPWHSWLFGRAFAILISERRGPTAPVPPAPVPPS